MSDPAARAPRLLDGLTEEQLARFPMCRACGYAMGGVDSWNGRACKCGRDSPPFRVLLDVPGPPPG